MAYNYLDEKQLKDALHDSEEYMRGYRESIPELQRLTRGKPGKVPQGKPKITTGTLAAIRREMPKQIIQQLPTGSVIIKGHEDMQDMANAILSDVILANANSGGTPFAKAKKAIRNQADVGSAWAYCFFNRRGNILHADYKILYYADVLFEKGKVSEFDTNFMPIVEWMTEGDIKAIIWREQQRKLTKSDWNLKALQKLLDNGPAAKDEDSKTPVEKKTNNNDGFFKLVRFLQVGVGATFYTYAPTIDEVVHSQVSKDPRGIIPVHGLVAEEDDDNPLGSPLAAISAGKQNLLDFDMQMYQYGQGLGYSPTIKSWGSTPVHKIKITPDNVIKMNGTKATDDIEVVNIGSSAISNFANNYGLIVSQIQSEMGNRSDTSVSGTSGNPGFSKTDTGVKQAQAVTDITNNDLNKSYELWQGRVYETLLNIQFAYSQGTKEIDMKPETMKRFKLDKAPKVNYDKDYGHIRFTVDASTSKAADDQKETTALTGLLEIKAKYGGQADDKFMQMYNQIVTNAGVDSADDLKYSDEEIQAATEMRREQMLIAHQTTKLQLQQASQPQQPTQQPKTLGESISWQPGDLSPTERAQALDQVGVKADSDGTDTPNAIANASKQTQAAVDTATKMDKHNQDMALAQDKHARDAALAIEKHAQDSAIAQDSHLTSQPQPQEAEAVA